MIDKLEAIAFFLSPAHACEYVNSRTAATLFTDPNAQLTTEIYGYLIQSGFRRSGNALYRPRCENCEACISLRIPVGAYRFSRSDKRVLRTNNDVKRNRLTNLDADHFKLYQRYLDSRHPGGTMQTDDASQFISFFSSSWCQPRFLEYRLGSRLIGVSIVDAIPNGLSAVYSFFEPDEAKRSFGTYCILDAILLAQEVDLDWLYLGYWIFDCNKMQYKSRFLPHELFYLGEWNPIQNKKQSEHFIQKLNKMAVSTEISD